MLSNGSATQETFQPFRWERYPHLAQIPHARAWLVWLTTRQITLATIDAYGRGLDDFLAFSIQYAVCVEQAPVELLRDHITAYVCDLTQRPVHYARRAPEEATASERFASKGPVLSPVHHGVTTATIRLRLLCLRLYLHYLIQGHIRDDTPFMQDRATLCSWWKDEVRVSAAQRELPSAASPSAGDTDRTVPYSDSDAPRSARHSVLSDREWQAVFDAVRTEPLRNRAMFALAYDTGLRRTEVCALRRRDIDTARCCLHVPSNRRLQLRFLRTAKTRDRDAQRRCGARRRNHVARQQMRLVTYSATTASVLDAFFQQSHPSGISYIFLSGSWRNRLQPVTPSALSKVLHRIALRSGVHWLTFCALRHSGVRAPRP